MRCHRRLCLVLLRGPWPGHDLMNGHDFTNTFLSLEQHHVALLTYSLTAWLGQPFTFATRNRPLQTYANCEYQDHTKTTQ